VTDRTDKPAQPRNAPPPVDEELEQERLEPGLNAGGTSGVGATPVRRKGDENSNT
jgi:hypothetical protein